MLGVQVGLIVVAFSTAYTPQPEGWLSTRRWLAIGLIALIVLLGGVLHLLGRSRARYAGAILALGAAVALYVAYEPQLGALPGLGFFAEGSMAALEANLAHLGALVAGVFLAVQWAVDRRALPRMAPFANALVATAVFVMALGGVMWVALHGIYDLSGASGIVVLGFRVVSYTLVMLACMMLPGPRGSEAADPTLRAAPAVLMERCLPHLYLGGALLVAVARGMMG